MTGVTRFSVSVTVMAETIARQKTFVLSYVVSLQIKLSLVKALVMHSLLPFSRGGSYLMIYLVIFY